MHPEDKIRGYEYGNQIVPVTDADLPDLLYKPDKCLQMICSLSEARLCEEWLMGSSTSSANYVVPQTSENAVLFSSLCEAMIENGFALLCRWVQQGQGRGRPRLCALRARKYADDLDLGENGPRLNGYRMYMTQLPMAQDVREWPFMQVPVPTATQHVAMDGFVDALTAQNPAIDVESIKSSTWEGAHNLFLARVLAAGAGDEEVAAEGFVRLQQERLAKSMYPGISTFDKTTFATNPT